MRPHWSAHEENAMDHRVERLRTPAECEIFARNAVAKNRPDLALEAQRKAVNLKVATHEAATPLEAEALATVYAHEALLAHRNGRKTRATGTWQAIKRHGIIEAIQKAVSRRSQTDNRAELREIGLEDLAFEAFVLRHEASFSPAAVQLSKERLAVTA
jgi:hypothetical protein